MARAAKSEGARRERAEASPQFRDGKFHNPSGRGPGLKGNPLPLFGEYFFGDAERKPPGPLPIVDPRPTWARVPESPLRITWMGHSTVLLEVEGARILTDPVFGERASPLAFAGPRRFHPVPAPLAALPPLDLVLLSHDHYDHLCRETIEELGRMGVPIVTALGVGRHLEKFGVAPERITELDWGERTAELAPGVRLTAVPSQHFSGRGVADRNRTLWASWVIETASRRIFFSGDTGLHDGLSAIGAEHGPFDLAMLEVGAFHPAWSDIHLGPDHALEAMARLDGGSGRGLLLPVHWGTFNLALHAWDDPAETLLRRQAESGARLVMPRLGAPTELDRIDPTRVAPWWREANGVLTPEPEPSPA